MTGATDTPLLEIRDLSVDYGSGEGAVHAVRDVNLVIHEGEGDRARRRVRLGEVDAGDGGHPPAA